MAQKARTENETRSVAPKNTIWVQSSAGFRGDDTGNDIEGEKEADAPVAAAVNYLVIAPFVMDSNSLRKSSTDCGVALVTVSCGGAGDRPGLVERNGVRIGSCLGARGELGPLPLALLPLPLPYCPERLAARNDCVWAM